MQRFSQFGKGKFFAGQAAVKRPPCGPGIEADGLAQAGLGRRPSPAFDMTLGQPNVNQGVAPLLQERVIEFPEHMQGMVEVRSLSCGWIEPNLLDALHLTAG